MVGVPRLFLIDSFGFIFRAYHARARSGAPPMRTAAGVQTEAVYIFHNMVKRLQSVHKPEYLVAIFESLGPTFRDAAFAAYKANRTETPPDLLEQIPWIRKTLEAMRIPVLEYDGFEADDVIGTLARRAAEQGVEVAIVSSDKDMLQLVNDRVRMMNPMKDDLWYDAAETEKYMGVQPSQVADLLALKGDSVDNIPGAPGIGDKGAKDLITRFGSVEGALEHAAEVEKRTYRESLQNHRDQILLSKQLATIHTDVPVPFELELWKAQEPDKVRLRELYKTLEFNRPAAGDGGGRAAGYERCRAARVSATAIAGGIGRVAGGRAGGGSGGGGGGRDDVGDGGGFGGAKRGVLGGVRRCASGARHGGARHQDVRPAIRRVPEPDARRDAVRISAIGRSGGVQSGGDGGKASGARGGIGPGGGSGCGAGDLPQAASGGGSGRVGGRVYEGSICR